MYATASAASAALRTLGTITFGAPAVEHALDPRHVVDRHPHHRRHAGAAHRQQLLADPLQSLGVCSMSNSIQSKPDPASASTTGAYGKLIHSRRGGAVRAAHA